MRLALELGLRDYVGKNGFGDVVIGLSGGIDSALTAAVAVERSRGGPCPRRLDAVAVLLAGDPGRRGAARPVARDRVPELPIEAMVEAFGVPWPRRSQAASPT